MWTQRDSAPCWERALWCPAWGQSLSFPLTPGRCPDVLDVAVSRWPGWLLALPLNFWPPGKSQATSELASRLRGADPDYMHLFLRLDLEWVCIPAGGHWANTPDTRSTSNHRKNRSTGLVTNRKDTLKNAQRQPRGWREIHANRVSDNGLECREIPTAQQRKDKLSN